MHAPMGLADWTHVKPLRGGQFASLPRTHSPGQLTPPRGILPVGLPTLVPSPSPLPFASPGNWQPALAGAGVTQPNVPSMSAAFKVQPPPLPLQGDAASQQEPTTLSGKPPMCWA
ncbi:unnamed protein product [Symbiodinium natans]|uniref:Uncharacterized protein n=1 Tax=Symbiodinium natans TaxID=878477 RepID=A0A812SMJ5_9DINO|nr:unnamed protein product [Symbiodinium natans]